MRSTLNKETMNNIKEIKKSLEKIKKTNTYDVEKYSRSLLHQTKQLEYFYCDVVSKTGNVDNSYYHIQKKPRPHQIAYFNIGRGFPKELFDGHWCYIVKDMATKVLVIPCTSIKKESRISFYEHDITINLGSKKVLSRLQLSDMRAVDYQRLDLRKKFFDVEGDRQEIIDVINDVCLHI